MEMILNLLTRCTRPHNLDKVRNSISENQIGSVKWWVLFDRNSVREIDVDILSGLYSSEIPTEIRFMKSESDNSCGIDMINQILPEIGPEEWIHILDDDNILHPDFWREIGNMDLEGKKAIVFSQDVGKRDFTGLDVREAIPENMRFQGVDSAQFVVRRDFVERFQVTYAFDGFFIEERFKSEPESFVLVNRVLSYYNRLSPTWCSSPTVLLIGGEADLKSIKAAGYESDHLDVVCRADDSDVGRVLSESDPDAVITVGETWNLFPNLSKQPYGIRKRWLHFPDLTESVGESAYQCSMNFILNPFYRDNPLVSLFTPIFNTGDKLVRTYQSVRNQSYSNWEWVLVNDSNDGGKTLRVAQEIAKSDPRVRVYDFREKTGGVVGESKYRSASLCSGIYLMELDHDDALTHDAVHWMVEAFRKYPDAKFVYSDCAEIYENHQSLTYEPGFSFGYGSYRDETYQGRTYKAMNTSNINPKTIRHIVGVPNHFRAWDRFFYHSIGGHNRRLPIADDYELIVRTFLKTRMVRIPKMLYLQYYHNSNTQNQTRADIQRRVRSISRHYNLDIKKRFEELGKNDWAYQGNPENPTWVESRFGEEENSVNHIFREDPYVYVTRESQSLNYLI